MIFKSTVEVSENGTLPSPLSNFWISLTVVYSEENTTASFYVFEWKREKCHLVGSNTNSYSCAIYVNSSFCRTKSLRNRNLVASSTQDTRRRRAQQPRHTKWHHVTTTSKVSVVFIWFITKCSFLDDYWIKKGLCPPWNLKCDAVSTGNLL